MVTNAPPLTVAALAERWGLSPRSVRRMIAAGRISVVKLTERRIVIPWGVVNAIENPDVSTGQGSAESEAPSGTSSGPKEGSRAASQRARLTGAGLKKR